VRISVPGMTRSQVGSSRTTPNDGEAGESHAGSMAGSNPERTEPIGLGYENTDVGRDDLSPVTDDYSDGDTAFTGRIHWVEMAAGQDSHDHLIDPEDVIRVAMARQ
jgi:hypothetical protein